jgi:two-component system nitrogen regulation sensor histidine kinase GlnL
VNLVRNAAEAIRSSNTAISGASRHNGVAERHNDAGKIRVSLTSLDGLLQLTVEDNGPGMPPAIAAAFMNPRPQTNYSNRGLGHPIVHELIQGTGGKLIIRVAPGRGTTISIRWPLSSRGDSTC